MQKMLLCWVSNGCCRNLHYGVVRGQDAQAGSPLPPALPCTLSAGWGAGLMAAPGSRGVPWLHSRGKDLHLGGQLEGKLSAP